MLSPITNHSLISVSFCLVVTSLAAHGYEAHLDELLLRLNFNGFYLSDNHRLKKISGKRFN